MKNKDKRLFLCTILILLTISFSQILWREVISAKNSTYYTCTGDCDFCVKDDYHLTKLNPEIGTDLEYQFMCNYDFHFISYKGPYSLYHRGGSVTELGMESNCTTFAKSLKFKTEDDFNACFFPFTKLNSMSTDNCECRTKHILGYIPQRKKNISCTGHCNLCFAAKYQDEIELNINSFSYECNPRWDLEHKDKNGITREIISFTHNATGGSIGTVHWPYYIGCNEYFEYDNNTLPNELQHFPREACFYAYPQKNTSINSCQCKKTISNMKCLIPTSIMKQISCWSTHRASCNFCVKDQAKVMDETIVMEMYSDIDKYVYACDDVTYHIEPTDSESTIYIIHESDSDCQKFLKEHDMTAGDRYLGNRKPAPFNKCFAHISNSSDPKDCSCYTRFYRPRDYVFTTLVPETTSSTTTITPTPIETPSTTSLSITTKTSLTAKATSKSSTNIPTTSSNSPISKTTSNTIPSSTTTLTKIHTSKSTIAEKSSSTSTTLIPTSSSTTTITNVITNKKSSTSFTANTVTLSITTILTTEAIPNIGLSWNNSHSFFVLVLCTLLKSSIKCLTM